jgi:hypothetical protein
MALRGATAAAVAAAAVAIGARAPPANAVRPAAVTTLATHRATLPLRSIDVVIVVFHSGQPGARWSACDHVAGAAGRPTNRIEPMLSSTRGSWLSVKAFIFNCGTSIASEPSMDSHLDVYLNDHFAGAVAALEILETLEHHPDAPHLNRFAAELRSAIANDRDELELLMRRADIEKSTTRRAVGWLSEKAAELKVRVDDPRGGALRAFELIEIVALGIDGKRALWSALATVAVGVPELRDTDFTRLSQRAEEQRQAIEIHRLEWAKAALTQRSS